MKAQLDCMVGWKSKNNGHLHVSREAGIPVLEQTIAALQQPAASHVSSLLHLKMLAGVLHLKLIE